ncbi:uncharacterized protein YndB with AHSA1/START domain [Kribbella pratensis]|uniref:Uncharacterized protein YndB with AHSA1/START domain n=1 Tax=Kribbella pratensis TaxID=2512112 RepID=A0ABY2FPA3_9ACTN|nr:SRPBCC domain-containing protein [Kribbella pratensis]TDW94965.1 uncharacterized protein YndB with AHSA1/START domain [Kribbella pratensis]
MNNVMTVGNSYTTSLIIAKTPREVFAAVLDPRSWWSEGIQGDTAKVGDEFRHRYQDVHFCRLRVTQVVPDKLVEWLVVENSFNFVADKTEWVGTTVSFEITEVQDGTELRFTHHGLVPEYECYDACSQGWNFYIGESLYGLVATGQGQPNAEGTARTAAERDLGTSGRFSTGFMTDAAPDVVVEAILDARGWWSRSIEGSTNSRGDEFTFEVAGVHWCRIRLADVVPGKQVVWDVLDARIEGLDDQREWIGTRIVFDVAAEDGGSAVTLTHIGLQSDLECYERCSTAWQHLMSDSLRTLIATGQGHPYP